MQVSVEAPNKLERRVTVIVPVEKLEEAYDKRISNLAKTAKVNGFRKGKIPLDYIKQRYGDSARQEALSEVIQKSLYAAINQEKLNPVGVPMVEPKTVLPGQPLEFIATFEIMPEVMSVLFNLNTLEKQIATIQEVDIEYVIQHLRQQHTKWDEVNREASVNDQVVIDFRGTIDGERIEGGEAHDYPVVIGSHSMIPGFEEGIVGMQPGEEKVIPVAFPENYFSKEYAGKQAQFTIKLLRVLQPNVPEVNQAFIQKMGVKSGNIDDLKVEIKKNLEREAKRVIKEKVKKQVFDHLLAQNPLDIPKAMVEREAKRIHDELHPHHAGKEHGHSEAEMATFNDSAKRNVILGLLVARLLKDHQILPNKERVTAHIEQLASVYENPQEVVKWYGTDKRSKADVEMFVLEEQLVEKLLENIQITEKEVSYNELINRPITATQKQEIIQ